MLRLRKKNIRALPSKFSMVTHVKMTFTFSETSSGPSSARTLIIKAKLANDTRSHFIAVLKILDDNFIHTFTKNQQLRVQVTNCWICWKRSSFILFLENISNRNQIHPRGIPQKPMLRYIVTCFDVCTNQAGTKESKSILLPLNTMKHTFMRLTKIFYVLLPFLDENCTIPSAASKYLGKFPRYVGAITMHLNDSLINEIWGLESQQ